MRMNMRYSLSFNCFGWWVHVCSLVVEVGRRTSGPSISILLVVVVPLGLCLPFASVLILWKKKFLLLHNKSQNQLALLQVSNYTKPSVNYNNSIPIPYSYIPGVQTCLFSLTSNLIPHEIRG